MLNENIRLTRLRGPKNARLTKRYFIDPCGKVVKDSHPLFCDGEAETHNIARLSDIESIITNLRINECISTGIFDIDKCHIIGNDQLDDKSIIDGERSRSKQYMKQPHRGLVLLDHDPHQLMPEPLRCSSPEALIAKLAEAIPAFENVGFAGSTSCSSGISTEDLEPYEGGGGLHVYLALVGGDLQSLRRYLQVKLWNARLGYIAFAKNGAMLIRHIVDLSVLSEERLIYEATPELGKGLVRQPREWQHREGPDLSGPFDVSDAEIAEYEQGVSRARKDPKAIAEGERLQDLYHGTKVKELAAKKSIPVDEAAKLLPRQSLADRESTRWTLDLNHIVEINGEFLTVEEVLARGAELDGTAMPDPIEGSEYGLTTAKYFYNDGINPCIHSFAHGLNVNYLLKQIEPLTLPTPIFDLDNVQSLDPDDFPHKIDSRNGNPILRPTIQNVKHLLQRYGITARYNVIAKKLIINIPNLKGSPENFSNTAINHIISLAALNGIPIGQIANFVETIGDENLFNPVADWITSKPWDGVDRLPEIYETLETAEDFPIELKEALLRRWLLSAVAAATLPSGFYGRGVLTLQGPQGIGKTTWIRRLVPDSMMQNELVLLGHHLDPGSKDSQITAVSHWIVEIGELDSSFRKDVARLKGFITTSKDKVRRPYAKADSEYPRRTVFCATVNEVTFLIDQTGNTRWWTMPVTKIDYQHNINLQQLYAQLKDELDQGTPWWLTLEENNMLDEQNLTHRAVSSVQERLLLNLDFDEPESGWKYLSATEALQHIGIDHPSNPQCRECGTILREHFGAPKKIQGVFKWRLPMKR